MPSDRVQKTLANIRKNFEEMLLEIDYNKIVCARSYNQIGGRMIDKFIKSAWKSSKSFQNLDENAKKILMTFIYNVGLGIYRRFALRRH